MNEKKEKRAFKYDRCLLLTTKKAVLIPAAWLLSVILHNAVYALTGRFWSQPLEEPFFFILAVVVIPLYALFSIIYTIIRRSLTRLPFKKR
ncbi:MAG: hypothetical protein HPY50_00690 [Firmicutes bacterium]|nr:hypothetical protein [Bacillota bacterium]